MRRSKGVVTVALVVNFIAKDFHFYGIHAHGNKEPHPQVSS